MQRKKPLVLTLVFVPVTQAMKKIAEYVSENELNPVETTELNVEMDQLKEEVYSLERQLRPSGIIH